MSGGLAHRAPLAAQLITLLHPRLAALDLPPATRLASLSSASLHPSHLRLPSHAAWSICADATDTSAGASHICGTIACADADGAFVGELALPERGAPQYNLAVTFLDAHIAGSPVTLSVTQRL